MTDAVTAAVTICGHWEILSIYWKEIFMEETEKSNLWVFNISPTNS